MPSHNSTPAIAETGPPDPEPSVELPKKRLLAKAGAVAGALALATGLSPFRPETAHAQPSSGTKSVQVSPKMFGVFESSRVDLVSETGFQYIEKDLWVTPGQKNFEQLSQSEQNDFLNYMQQARADGLKVVLNLWQVGWPHGKNHIQYPPPSRPNQWRDMCDVGIGAIQREQADAAAQGQPSAITTVVLGVEPNSAYFWSGQKNAPAQYENWAASCFDKFQAKLPGIEFYIGALASQAGPGGTGPEAFIAGMCQAEAESGRTQPIMDGFAMHSYEDAPPETTHPGTDEITIGDSQKLENDLSCFNQGNIPILWNEVGYQSEIPSYQAYRYKGKEGPGAIPEQQQGQDYADALKMADCDPNTAGLFIFHIDDDPNLDQWQSGLYYANPGAARSTSQRQHPDAAKQSLPIVQQTLQEIQNGEVTCS